MTDTNKYITVPEDSLILGQNQYYSKDGIKTQLNNNVVVVGTSGAGKTRSIVMPNLLQASGSYVVSDPKGNLYRKMGPYLESKGYRVIHMDFRHPERSLHYNPIAYCKTTTDAMKLASALVYETAHSSGNGEGRRGSYDPFWDETTLILLSALIGYLMETDQMEADDKNLATLSTLLSECQKEERGNSNSIMTRAMERHRESMEERGLHSWAYDRFRAYNVGPAKTNNTVCMTSQAKLSTFDTEELREMLRYNDLDFTKIGQEPTALFVEVSDTDRSMDVLVNLFYTQLMNQLCDYADDCCENSCLPVPVQFILDDFATNARIDNFQNMIANIRSRGISAMLMVQSEAQLEAGYGRDAQTIIDNCNTYVYMGGSNPRMAHIVGERADKPANRILNMPLSTSWIFRRGQEPVLCHNFDIDWFSRVKGFEPGKPAQQQDREVI